MDAFEVALSEEVRKYKHLYNSSLRDHKDSRAVNSSWTEIADTLSADATYCRKRWQNLRDKFTKARRRMMTWRRRPGGRNRVPVLYTVLRWLDCHIKPKPSMKMTISQAEFVLKQEQPSPTPSPTPSCQPISRSPSTEQLELELSDTVNDADEFDCSELYPSCPSPPSPPVPTPAPSIPVPVPPCLPPTPPPLRPAPPTTPPTPTVSSPRYGGSSPLLPAPSPTPTDVAASYPSPWPTSCPGLSTPSCPPGPSTPSCPPGPSTPSCLRPSAGRSVPRSRKRKRTSEPEGLNFQSLFAALDQRRADREAAMEAGRERRTAVIGRLLEQPRDECDRYVLHVADFMRSLPSDHLSEFKFKLQNLMRETEQAVRKEVVENGFATVKGDGGHQNGEER